MKRKQKFETPTVLQTVDLSLEGALLAQSIVDTGVVLNSAGQEVVNIDAGGDEFDWNGSWEWDK